MSKTRFVRTFIPFCAGVVAAFAFIRTTGAQGEGGMPAAGPSPQHEALKAYEGEWDAKVELTPGPGVPPMVSKGVETVRIGCGGLWALTDFESKDMMGPGMDYQGHGLTGYDPEKKKYLNLWVDSMTQSIHVAEGTLSADGKTWTFLLEAPDQTGKMTKYREVSEKKDADHRVFSMFQPGPDGKEMLLMKIEYTRRKAR